MRNKQTTILIALLCSLTLLWNCTSSTVIETIPPGATLYINGEIMGETPFQYSDKKIAGTALAIRIKKPGYKTLRRIITKEDEINVGALIGAIFCLFPGLWLFNYKPFYRYELEPGQGESFGPRF